MLDTWARDYLAIRNGPVDLVAGTMQCPPSPKPLLLLTFHTTIGYCLLKHLLDEIEAPFL